MLECTYALTLYLSHNAFEGQDLFYQQLNSSYIYAFEKRNSSIRLTLISIGCPVFVKLRLFISALHMYLPCSQSGNSRVRVNNFYRQDLFVHLLCHVIWDKSVWTWNIFLRSRADFHDHPVSIPWQRGFTWLRSLRTIPILEVEWIELCCISPLSLEIVPYWCKMLMKVCTVLLPFTVILYL